MARVAVTIKRFDGGWSPDEQIGPPHSFAYSRSIDFRKAPSKLTVLPKTTREGQGTITDLIQNTVMDSTGAIYAIGHLGNFYRRATDETWSVLATLSDGAYGISHRPDVGKLFMTSSTTISEYSPLTGNPSISVDKYAQSASTLATLSGGAATYAVPTALSESGVDRQEFTSDIEPLRKVRLRVATAGTGDWTLTMHDAIHTTLGTATVLNADITDGQDIDFEFADQIRAYVKPNARTYHFHLTSTAINGTVVAGSAGDFNTCDFTVYADRLIDTKNGMHPIETFLQYECIGNGNYLAVWEPLSDEPTNLEFLRHRLVFPAGLEVCGLARYQEYLAIACEKRTDSGNAQTGIIFFWDGLSSTYNYFMAVPEGSPYNLHEYKDVLYYEAGGALYAYTGGSPYKIRTLPNTDSEYSDVSDITRTYPYMATVRRGVHLIGFPSHSTNVRLEHGVYSYGANNKDFTDSFGFNYTISTGTTRNTSSNLKLGHVRNYGDTLFISWQDGASEYGVDVVDNTSDPATASTWESLFIDFNTPHKEKTGAHIILTYDPLPDGCEVVLKYRTERNGTWTESEAYTNANTTNRAKFVIHPKRFYEMQIGLDITCTTETPIISGITLVADDNRQEGFLK